MAAWPKKGRIPWISTATMTRTTFAGSPGRNPALIMSTSPAPTIRISPSTSKPIWVIQLKNEIGRDAVGAERRPVDGEDGRSGVRPLQRAQPEQEEGQVAQHDDDDDLGEGEPERHEDGAVDEVLDLHARAGPHAADVPRPRPSLALRDEVDPVLLDVERLFGLRVVDDRQVFRVVLGDRHRSLPPLCSPRGASWTTDKARSRDRSCPRQHPRPHVHSLVRSITRQVRPASLSERPKVDGHTFGAGRATSSSFVAEACWLDEPGSLSPRDELA